MSRTRSRMSDGSEGQPRWGAVPLERGLWRFALWAPSARATHVLLDGARHPLSKDDAGWHSADIAAEAGATYLFERDGETFPDPASRFQDGGVGAASMLVDPAAGLRDVAWAGRPWDSAVILEIHVGTFTAEGTLAAAAARLPALARLGITAVELMPLGQFEGARGWGYDGVLPFALHPAYGTPDELADFIAAAHANGLMVLIDAVYNHFGPEGNVLSALCPAFFDTSRQTPWGAAIALDRAPVRAFFLQNAEMWLRDYGADGLRLDAVHQLEAHDSTDFLHELGRRVGAMDLGRPVHLVTEDERNLASYITGEGAIRAQWNDDYHHAVHCLLTGESHSYYAPFAVDPFGDLVTALAEGQVDQGQPRPAGAEPRGEPSGHLPPACFVNANQTHDQIGNRALGDRLIALSELGAAKVMHALLLLSPFVPMLFMGEEEGARAPFRFFTDFEGGLAHAVREGRRSEFPEFADHKQAIPDPNAVETFEASRPYASPAPDAKTWRALTAHLLDLRREKVLPLLRSGWIDSRVSRLGDRTLHARWGFRDGLLDLTMSLEGPAPDLPDDVAEIFHMDGGDAGMRVGTGAIA